jgi:hypothetical protein
MASSHPILAVAFSEESESWNISVIWPGEGHRERDTYGPYDGFIEARKCADGIALRLTEDGHTAPQIIVLAGALWGKVTAF